MDEFTVLLKAIVDAKDTQAQLNAIKNLSIKIEKLNLDQSVITELRKQLSKNGIDVNLVLGNTNQLQNQAKQTGQQIGDTLNTAIKTTMRPLSELKTGTGNIAAVFDKNGLLDVEASLNQIKQTYAEFGQVKITNKLFDSDGNIESFRVNIEQVNGDLKETRNFMMAINGTSFTFPDDIIKGSESIVQHLDKTKNAINQTGDAINLLKSKAASDEIQLSIGNGDFETKILSYETALKKLGLSSEEITARMKGVKSAYNELSASAKGDNIIPDDVVAKAATLNTEMFKLSNITKQIRLNESLNANQIQIDQAVVRLNEQLRKNTAYSKEAKSKIRAWLDELEKGNVAEAKLKQINSEAKQLHANMASLNKVGFSWTDKLKNAWSKFGGWSFATGTFMAGIHQTTEAFKELKEIDTILTEISKTSDRTQKSLENLGKSAVDSANEYGATISGYLSGVKEAARAGFDESQQEEIAELSILAQSAGDMTDELANEYIIATNAAYKLNGEISKLNKVLDGQNYITNHNAVNMSELAEATKVVASQAASSNVEIDKLTASVGTMMAVTQQGGDIAARAFKAILMNIQQVSGEVADGEEISTDDLTKYQKACEELGVSLSEVKNGIVSLRDPMQVLKELSEAYASLDKMDARRANLISAVGGKYRGNQLNALLENWNIYEKMLSEYSQGEGSALEEAKKTAESWQGLLNQISNNWTGFIQNFADDGLVTNTLKFINELVKGTNSLVKTFGALPTLITAIGTGLGAKNIGKCA